MDWNATSLRKVDEGTTFGCDFFFFFPPINLNSDMLHAGQQNGSYCIYYVSLVIRRVVRI